MSDYIYSSNSQVEGVLTKQIQSIYTNSPPEVQEFHGEWGALAVSESRYSGFQPLETEEYIIVVIGAPVFYFRDNNFLVGDDSSEATMAINQRWNLENNIQWDEDLSGPFTVLYIDKKTKCINVVTDLMSFLPVYYHQSKNGLYIGTHVDALAITAKESQNIDITSLADFVLHDIITFPYTAYTNIKQMEPSCVTTFGSQINSPKMDFYWEPKEVNPYSNLKEASEALRQGLKGYVEHVTSKMDKVAQFISGGEDSRALAGILPSYLQRDAYVFLDEMNREGKIAKKIADKYEAQFIVGYRKKTHYLDILPEASRLVGTGHQYHHAHSLEFDEKFKLNNYSAVFGGYLSDSLLKSAHALRYIKVKTDKYPFIPHVFKKGETRTQEISNKIINNYTLEKINERRIAHFNKIKELRPKSAHEWFVLYPATMRTAIPNIYTTRRLFKSYEPFMCKEAVKISSSVPAQWKLNRRLFNGAMKPYLAKSKWVLHADGRLPYFSWWLNSPIQFPTWLYRDLKRRFGLAKNNQGPWCDWLELIKSKEWHQFIDEHSSGLTNIGFESEGNDIHHVLNTDLLPEMKRVNLLQVAFKVNSIIKS